MDSKAWEGAVDGMNRAADHAEVESPEWKDRALQYFVQYARNQNGAEFMACDVIESAKANGRADLESPDPRAWGHVAKRAASAGHVERCGYSMRTLGKGNATPRALWRYCGA